MSGNVYEWTQDWHGLNYYFSSPGTDPPGPIGPETTRVSRGGSYTGPTWAARVAFRGGGTPGDRLSDIGFRLARTVP